MISRVTRMLLPAHLALLAVASLAAGCATDDGARPEGDNAPDWRSGGKGDGQTCEFDAESAATYLSHFTYQEIPSETGGSSHYRVGFTFDRRATLASGDQADFTMYLLDGGRAIVEYAELHPSEYAGSETLNQTVVVTRYHVDSTTRALTIDGVGTGTPLTASTGNGGCAPAYDFTYSGDLRSTGLAGGKTVAYAGSSSSYVIDPDHLDDVPSETARRWFEEDVASGRIVVIRK